MIKASELRIGNLVYGVSDRVETIYSIHSGLVETTINKSLKQVSTHEISDIQPIEITPYILINAGFEDNMPFKKKWGEHHYFILDDEKRFHVKHGESVCRIAYDIKYVHQLQNLYFALTGEELTINL